MLKSKRFIVAFFYHFFAYLSITWIPAYARMTEGLRLGACGTRFYRSLGAPSRMTEGSSFKIKTLDNWLLFGNLAFYI